MRVGAAAAPPRNAAMAKLTPRRRLWLSAFGLLALAAWLGSSLHRIDPREEIAVLDGGLWPATPILIEGSRALAPHGLLRLHRYPRRPLELSLPRAGEAMLRSSDGSRFGFRGFVELRPREESWRELHAAAQGGGVRGLLVDAIREAARGLDPGGGRSALTPSESRELASRLGERLGLRGVELGRLELEELDFLSAREGPPSSVAESRLLVIGLDGADWEIIDGLIEAGRLPHLERLVADGARAKLLSISPMISPVVWTSAATGVEPTRHGILDFLVEGEPGEPPQPVTSAQRQVPTVWEILSRAGVEVGVIGWWATWPAEPVRGYLVSDRIAYQLFGYHSDPEDARGKTWPPALYDEIRPVIREPAEVGWERLRPYLSGSRSERGEFDAEERGFLDELRTLIASGETYFEIARELARQRPARLQVVYFEGTDTVAHLFMRYRPPRLPGVEAERAESFSAVVDRYYETVDRFVGELVSERDEGWTIMVLSDHGFASDATRPRTTDSRIGHGAAADWHRRFGIFVLSGAAARSGVRLEEATIYDIAPTILALFGQPVPRSWPGRVLGPALTDAFLQAHPVRYRDDEPARGEILAGQPGGAGAPDLLAKLQSLGYVGSGAAGSESARNNAGLSLLAQGRYEEAEREFRRALSSGGAAPVLLVNLALALRFQAREEEAVAILERAITYPATRRAATNQLAGLRMASGDLDGAELLARELLRDEPDAAELRNTLGLILGERGDEAGAERAFRHAAELDPHMALARNNLGNLHKRAGRPAEAERWYLAAIEADPYFLGPYNNLALVHQEKGEWRRAIDLYSRALVKVPDNAIVLNNLASLYFTGGEYDPARRLWRRATEVAPDYPSPFNNLAGLEIVHGRHEEAERLLRRALEIEPDYGDARINLAIILEARGEADAAREELLKAAEDRRSAAEAHERLRRLEAGS